VDVVSALGGAMAWAGLIGLLAAVARGRPRLRLPVVVVALAVVLAVAVPPRADRMRAWSRAGADADTILAALPQRIPRPAGTIVLGPAPLVEDNVAPFVTKDHIGPAAKLTYDDRSVEATVSRTQEEFDRVPPDDRLDIRPLSTLEP
jgi:hypothetical protein